MRGVRVVVRAILGVAIVAGGVSGAILPAQADPAVAPGVPTRVVTSGVTPTSMYVSWNAPSDDGGAAISDYTIEYRKVGELSWSTFAHTADPSTFATVTGLTRASTYAFRVAAVNSVDTGWINEENPVAEAVRTAAAHNFQTPIDEVDAAARILDPVFAPLLDAQQADGACRVPYGAFFKDYFFSEW